MDPSACSTGDGVGFVSVDEEIPEERCVRTRGGDKYRSPLVHCFLFMPRAGGFGRKTAHLCNL